MKADNQALSGFCCRIYDCERDALLGSYYCPIHDKELTAESMSIRDDHRG